jgi:hypothetical protein
MVEMPDGMKVLLGLLAWPSGTSSIRIDNGGRCGERFLSMTALLEL